MGHVVMLRHMAVRVLGQFDTIFRLQFIQLFLRTHTVSMHQSILTTKCNERNREPPRCDEKITGLWDIFFLQH